MYIFIQSGEFNSMLSMFDTNGCGHGFSSNWDQRRCRQQHPLAKCGCPLTQEPAQALISCDAAGTRIPAVWRLSAAHHGLSAMPALYSPVCYAQRSADMGYPHVRVSS